MKHKISSRLLALLLCFALLLPNFSSLAVFAQSTAALQNGLGQPATTTAKPLAVVLAGSDVQYSNATYNGVTYADRYAANGALIKDILNRMKKDYPTIDGAFLLGDYEISLVGDHTASSSGLAASYAALNEVYGLTDNIMTGNGAANQIQFVQGNHDPADTTGLDATGAYKFDHYEVYQINHDDFPWSNKESVVQATAAGLKSYLEGKVAEGYTKPIFVITHVPLHHSFRGDNRYASYLADILNEAGKDLNIIFMFGHNHSGHYDDYIGGTNICLTPGQEMLVTDLEKLAAGTSALESYKSMTLNFTYMNAGYLGYSGGTLTSTVFEIYEDRVEMARYSKNGPCNLKNEGVSYKPEDKEKIDGSWDADTTVLESPYVLNLSDISLSVVSSTLGEVLPFGSTAQMQIGVTSETPYTVSWEAMNPDVVSLTPDAGDATKVTVTGVGYGTATIKATVKSTTDTTTAPAALYFDVAVVQDDAVKFNGGKKTVLYKLVTDWSTLTTGKNYMILNTDDVGAAYALAGPTPNSDSRNEDASVYMTSAKVFQIPGDQNIYTTPVNNYDIWQFYDNADGTARYLGHISDSTSFLAANRLIDSALSYAQPCGFRFCSGSTSDGVAYWTIDAENQMLDLHSYYESGEKVTLTPASPYTLNYNATGKTYQLRPEDDATGSNLYIYEETNATVPEMWMWPTGLSGEVKMNGSNVTGAAVAIMHDNQVTNVPITTDMLVGAYSEIPGDRTCELYCYGQLLTDEFKISVTSEDGVVIKPVTLVENQGNLYKYRRADLNGATFVTVNRNTAGSGQAMTVQLVDGEYVLVPKTVNVFAIEGIDELFVQAEDDSWLWDQESSSGSHFIKSRANGKYLQVSGTNLVFQDTPGSAWRTNTTHYTLTEINSKYVIEQRGDSYVAAARVNDSGGVGYIYVPETELDRVLVYMTDCAGSIEAGAGGALTTGETISKGTYYLDGTSVTEEIPVTIDMLDISPVNLVVPGEYKCKVTYSGVVVCEEFVLTVTSSAEKPPAADPVIISDNNGDIFKLTTDMKTDGNYVFINSNAAGEVKAFAVTKVDGKYEVKVADIRTFDVGENVFVVVRDQDLIWKTATTAKNLSLYNEANNAYVFMETTGNELVFSNQAGTYGWRSNSNGFLCTNDDIYAALAWTGQTFIGYPRNSMAGSGNKYTYIYQQDEMVDTQLAYVDAITGSCAAGSPLTTEAGGNVVIKTLLTDGTVGTQIVPITLGMLEGLAPLDLFVADTYTCSVVYDGMVICTDYQLTINPAEGETPAADKPVVMLENNGQIFSKNAAALVAGKNYIFVDRAKVGTGYLPAIELVDGKYTIAAKQGEVFTVGDSGNFSFLAEDDSWVWTAVKRTTSTGGTVMELTNRQYGNRLFVNADYQLVFVDEATAATINNGWRSATGGVLCTGSNSGGEPYAAIKRDNNTFTTIDRNVITSLAGAGYIYVQDETLNTILAYVDALEGQCFAGSSTSVLTGGNVVVKSILSDGTVHTDTVPITLGMLDGIEYVDLFVPGTYSCSVVHDGKVISSNYELTITAAAGEAIPADKVVTILDVDNLYRLPTSNTEWVANGSYIFVSSHEAGTAYALTVDVVDGQYVFGAQKGEVFSMYEGGDLFFRNEDPSSVFHTSSVSGVNLLMVYNHLYGDYLFVNEDYELMLTDAATAAKFGYGWRYATSAALSFGNSGNNPYASIKYKNGSFHAIKRATDYVDNGYIYVRDESVQAKVAYVDSLSGACAVGSSYMTTPGGNVVVKTIVNGSAVTETFPITLSMLKGIDPLEMYTPGTHICEVWHEGQLISSNYELTVTADGGDTPAAAPVYVVKDGGQLFQLTDTMVADQEYVLVDTKDGGEGRVMVVNQKDGVYWIGSASGVVISDGLNTFIKVEDTDWIWETANVLLETNTDDMLESLSLQSIATGKYLNGFSMTNSLTPSDTVPVQVGWRISSDGNFAGQSKLVNIEVIWDGQEFCTVTRHTADESMYVYAYERLDQSEDSLSCILAYVDATAGQIETGSTGYVTPGGSVIVKTIYADGVTKTAVVPITLDMLRHNDPNRPSKLQEFNTPGVYEYSVWYSGVEICSSYQLTVTGTHVGKHIVLEGDGNTVIGSVAILDTSNKFESVPAGTGGMIPTGSVIQIYTYYVGGEVTSETVPVTVGMLSDPTGNLNLNKEGTYTDLTVNYRGEQLARGYTLTLTAYELDDYPDFPDEGSVRVDKQLDTTRFNYLETGSAKIDLSVTGISSTGKANVVIILDASSSMLLCTHELQMKDNITEEQRAVVNKAFDLTQTLTDEEIAILRSLDFADSGNSDYYTNLTENRIAGKMNETTLQSWQYGLRVYGFCRTSGKWVGDGADNCKRRFQIIKESLEELLIFLKQDMDGYSTDIDVAVAYFNKPYTLGTDYHFLNSASVAYNVRDDAELMLPFTNSHEVNVGQVVDAYKLSTGTNYDRAMEWAYQLLAQKQTDDYLEYLNRGAVGNYEPRQDFVLFMSDGAPNQLNYMHETNADVWGAFRDGTLDEDNLDKYVSPAIADVFKELYHPEGKMWLAEAIKGDKAETYKVIDPSRPEDKYVNYVPGLGATMMTVSLNVKEAVLGRIATSTDYYYEAETGEDISAAFNAFGSLVISANGAAFVDQMGADFDLQMDNRITLKDGSVVTLNPTITVQKHELYKYSELNRAISKAVTVTSDMVGKSYYVSKNVTINEDMIGSRVIINGEVIIAAEVHVGNPVTVSQMITITDDMVGSTIYTNTEAVYVTADIVGTKVPVVDAVYITSDMVGSTMVIDGISVTVTEDMVGRTFAVSKTIQISENQVGGYVYVDQRVFVTADMVGTRKGTAPEILETVTFDMVDGKLVAYSTINGVTSGNILGSDGVIYAKTFWYNTNTNASVTIDSNRNGMIDKMDFLLDSETFYWIIDNIPEDELVFSYDVYLTGSIEGGCAAGRYPTNNYAYLSYTNFMGTDCVLYTTSPELPWGQATVAYAFYLVDENGNPLINETTGEIGSFEHSIKMTQPVYLDLLLNSDGDITPNMILDAQKLIPYGYELYDTKAKYSVYMTADGIGAWQISGADGLKATTYVTAYGGNPTTMTSVTAGTGENYDLPAFSTSSTVVWFAVRADAYAAPDTVVIDYGLSVDINVLINDIMMTTGNAVLVGVGDSAAASTTTKLEGIYGVAEIVNDGTANYYDAAIRYTLNRESGMGMKTEETFWYTVSYTTGLNHTVYYTAQVTIIPGTTIYYEDNFVNYSVITKDGTGNATTSDGGWTQEGTTVDALQSEDRPGEYSLPEADANYIYGYEGAYTNMTAFSMGSAQKITVNSGKSGKVTFKFWGTGFDVVSLTSNTTGTILVNVFQLDSNNQRIDAYNSGSDDSTVNPCAAYMVNTYYGYKFENGKWVVNSDASDSLYQVPVIKADLNQVTVIGDDSSCYGYGHYEVELLVSYMGLFDHDKDGSYDFYLDAIRIYDPANDGANNSTIQDAYAADAEGWPAYQELRDLLISKDTFDSYGKDDVAAGVIFIDGNPALKDSNASGVPGTENDSTEQAAIADYTNYGPNNELYLAPGQAIAFDLNVPAEGETVDSNIAAVHLALKSVGGTAKVKIYNAKADVGIIKENAISTATELYYDISYLNGQTVVIYNSGTGSDAILSITNLKTTFKADPYGVQGSGESNIGYTPETGSMALASLGAQTVVPTLKPAYPSLSLEDEVQINVYYTVENLGDVALENMGLITFNSALEDGTIDDAAEMIPGAEKVDSMYMVHTAGIPAKELGDTVYFKIYVRLADGSHVYSKLLNYSPVRYAEEQLAGNDQELQAVLGAMLNYGAAAQQFFDYKTDALVNAGLSSEQKALVSDYDSGMITVNTAVDSTKAGAFAEKSGFSARNPSVTLDGAFAINYYFIPSQTVDGEMTMYYWDKETYDSVSKLTAENASGSVVMEYSESVGAYTASYTGIAAKEIDKPVYVAGVYESDGTTHCTGVIVYSLSAYFKDFAEDESNALNDLAQATAVYGFYAKNYFAKW